MEIQEVITLPPSVARLLGVSRVRSSCGHCHITTETFAIYDTDNHPEP